MNPLWQAIATADPEGYAELERLRQAQKTAEDAAESARIEAKSAYVRLKAAHTERERAKVPAGVDAWPLIKAVRDDSADARALCFGSVCRARWRRDHVEVYHHYFSEHDCRWLESSRPVVTYRADGVPAGLYLRKPRVTPELLAQIAGPRP